MNPLKKQSISAILTVLISLQHVGVLLFSPTVAAATLNLNNVDIRSLINTVSKITNTNFIIDPRVNGRVTVLIAQDLPPEALYQVFLSILNVHGYVVIEGEHVTKILPASQSKSASSFTTSEFPDNLSTTVIPIKHINAQQIIPVLRPFVAPTAFLSVYAPTNVLIIHDTSANIERLRGIIAKIDRPLSSSYEVVELQHASASEMAKIITTFIAKNKNDPASSEVKIASDIRTNRLIISASENQRLKIRALVADLDIGEEQGNTNVIYLRYSDATELLPILQGVIGAGAKGKGAQPAAAAGSNSISIQADKPTNAIVITASQDQANQVNSIKSVIRRLDIRRAQVLIEAIIAEVNTDVTDQLGVQYLSNTNNAVGIVNFNNQIPSLAGSVSAGTPPSVPLGSSVLFGQVDDRQSLRGFGAVLNALESNGNVNILSTPALVTLDNQEASILVGREVPFISNTQLSASNTNPFQNFERRDVGLTLKVKPQINEGDTVHLDIEQEISSVLPTAQAVDTVTSKRTLKTTVLVEDGKILVLGGLIDEQESENKQSIPLFGDLPLIGFLFRFDTDRSTKRNLMIFIKPTILRDELDREHVTSGKYNFIRSQQIRMREEGNLESSRNTILGPLDALNQPTQKVEPAPEKPKQDLSKKSSVLNAK